MAETSQHAPLTPPDCDLTGLKYMPLVITRLRQSSTWARARYNPQIGFAAMNLWMQAWVSVPAASLENDEFVLAEAAMCDIETWRSISEEVLRGWVLCSDGRLYHPLVAHLAMEVWRKRGHHHSPADSETEPSDIETKATGPLPDEIVPPPPEPTIVSGGPPSPPPSGLPPPNINKSKDKYNTTARVGARGARAGARACVCARDPDFDLFWERYPVKMAPRDARREWDAAIARGATGEEILAGMARHRFASRRHWVKHPANWLRGECWKTEGVPPETSGNGWADILNEFIRGDAPIVDMTPEPGRVSPVVGHG